MRLLSSHISSAPLLSAAAQLSQANRLPPCPPALPPQLRSLPPVLPGLPPPPSLLRRRQPLRVRSLDARPALLRLRGPAPIPLPPVLPHPALKIAIPRGSLATFGLNICQFHPRPFGLRDPHRGKGVGEVGIGVAPINIKGYETLLDLVENTSRYSFDLYYGLFLYNDNAMEQLKRLDMAFKTIQNELSGRLHRIYLKQLFGNAEGRENWA
ncbi:hypothetical protein NL676_006898 [Syzygium grande]|nr:hypothetical protein NL676_006898 [Syzygium grande]